MQQAALLAVQLKFMGHEAQILSEVISQDEIEDLTEIGDKLDYCQDSYNQNYAECVVSEEADLITLFRRVGTENENFSIIDLTEFDEIYTRKRFAHDGENLNSLFESGLWPTSRIVDDAGELGKTKRAIANSMRESSIDFTLASYMWSS